MIDAIRTGSSVLRYRGGEGQWAWAIHRVAGLGIWAFLALHIFDIFLAAFGPTLFEELLFIYKGPVSRVIEILLVFGLIYHAVNGLRIILADFFPALASLKTARRLFWGEIVVFLVLFLPASYVMATTVPPFEGNIAWGVGVTAAILAIPLVIAVLASFAPSSAELALDSDLSTGNYGDSFKRILLGTQRRRMDRFEINVWLFMRFSGLFLIILALLHVFILHFVISVETITFQTLIDRWQAPGFEGFFWRTYDMFLLILGFTHGILGLRNVIQDYFHSVGWRRLLIWGTWGLWVALMLAGAYIIFFFNGSAA